MTPNQIATFQAVAGITPTQLASVIKTLVAAALFIWALWMLMNCLTYLRQERGSVYTLVNQLLRISLVIMVGLILVA